jgi:hypothetical protein
MTNFSKNIRIDLSDREVHVPKKEKFKVVREGEEWNSQSNISMLFGLSVLVALIFMFISIAAINKEWESVGIWCLITFLMCALTLFIGILKYEFKWQTWIWVFNTILWFFNTILHIG